MFAVELHLIIGHRFNTPMSENGIVVTVVVAVYFHSVQWERSQIRLVDWFRPPGFAGPTSD